jgi:hypothetical protein
MNRRSWLGASLSAFPIQLLPAPDEEVKLRILLDPDQPGRSRGIFPGTDELEFAVGFGRNGTTPAGSAFEAGSSLLGRFSVSAILTKTSFAMAERLVTSSGRSREWLEKNLFTNMNSLDFDGDGKSAEYGDVFIGLEPLDSDARQPFHFGEYKGVYRWYSYAIHGTQDEARVGKCITGGCINVGQSALSKIVKRIRLGDQVVVEKA